MHSPRAIKSCRVEAVARRGKDRGWSRKSSSGLMPRCPVGGDRSTAMGLSVPLALESGNQMEGGQREEHAGDAHDGLANRPSLEGLSDAEPEAVLDDPEAGIVEVTQEE